MKSKIPTSKNKKSEISIPIAVLKQSEDICVPPLTDLSNNTTIAIGLATRTWFSNYYTGTEKVIDDCERKLLPISVLPSVSKFFEKLLQDQLTEHMKDKL